jgi:hypothetical protein
MKTVYSKAIPIGKQFDKAKCIEGKLKLLSDIGISLTKREMETLDTLNTPRQIEKYIRSIINNRWN